jgi:hypothetical protein
LRMILLPNAGHQARPIAGARDERRLLGVACMPWLGAGLGREPRLGNALPLPRFFDPSGPSHEPVGRLLYGKKCGSSLMASKHSSTDKAV